MKPVAEMQTIIPEYVLPQAPSFAREKMGPNGNLLIAVSSNRSGGRTKVPINIDKPELLLAFIGIEINSTTFVHQSNFVRPGLRTPEGNNSFRFIFLLIQGQIEKTAHINRSSGDPQRFVHDARGAC